MKRILILIGTASGYLGMAFHLWAQNTTPRGPSEWTVRNWMGFFIQIGLFLLAVIGIYKLAIKGEDLEEEEKEAKKSDNAD